MIKFNAFSSKNNSDGLLEQAEKWGFPCQRDLTGIWQILPQQQNERWIMQQVADKWLLIVGGIPQVSLHLHEATTFLERRLPRYLAPRNLEPKGGCCSDCG